MQLPPLTLRGWLRYELVRRLFVDLEPGRHILEIGAGEGALGVRLARRHEYVGIELDLVAYEKSRRRLGVLGRGQALHGDLCVVAEGQFDVVCSFEVLEHIEDDVGALREWRERIRPGGCLVISVPAHQHRYGPMDRRVGHYRRYSRSELDHKLHQAGYLGWEIFCYGFPLDYVLEALRNRLSRSESLTGSMEERTRTSGRLHQPPDWLGWATMLASAPFRILQLPFRRTDLGTGWVVRARVPSTAR